MLEIKSLMNKILQVANDITADQLVKVRFSCKILTYYVVITSNVRYLENRLMIQFYLYNLCMFLNCTFILNVKYFTHTICIGLGYA
jgi:hypothetical protein